MTAGIRKGLFWVAIAALVGVGVGVATRAFAVHPVRVTSGSMAPTAKVGDWLVASDLDAQGRESVGRRDIVLFRFPLGTTGRAVKRVIAVGGDTVAYTDRYVSVNGRRSPIAGSPADLGPDGKPTGKHQPERVVHIPSGHVFLLGDNTAVSIDSRAFGPVPETELVGRVKFVIPQPPRRAALAIAVVVLVLGGVLLTIARHPQSVA